MGLREKVALVLIAVVLYKTVCSLCKPQPLNENPFEKYLNKRKYSRFLSKSRPLSKCTTKNEQKNIRFIEDFRKQNVYKTHSFPEADCSSDTYSKVPTYLLNTEYDITDKPSSINVLSDSTLINNLRKEKRRKRKNKNIEKTYSRDDLPLGSVPELFPNQESSVHFTDIGLFPEVQYPLSASETWAPNYWNLLPSYKEDAYFKKDSFDYKHKNKINKPNETLLQPSAIKENKGMLKINEKTVKTDFVTSNVKDKEFNKEILGKYENNRMPNQSLLNIEEKNIKSNKPTRPVTKKKKNNSLKKIKTERQPTSKKSFDPLKEVISESILSRSGSKEFPPEKRVLSFKRGNKTKSKNMCVVLDSITPCINSTKDLLLKQENNDRPTDVALPSLTDSISNAHTEIKDAFNNDLSSEVTSEVLSVKISDDLSSDFSKDESFEKNSEILLNSTFNDIIVNNQSRHSSNTPYNELDKLELLFDDITMKSTVESYPADATDALTSALQSYEVSDYPGLFIDDSIRQRILNVLLTKKLSVPSLRKNILDILFTKEQINSYTFKEPLTDSPQKINIPKSPLYENIPSVDILEFPLTNKHSSEVLDEFLLSDNPSNKYIYESQLSVCPRSEDILEFPLVTNLNFSNPTVTDKFTESLKEVISKTSWNGSYVNNCTETIYESSVTDNSSNITLVPKELKTISANDSVEVTFKLSDSSLEIVPEQRSELSNSYAFVKDLHEIIRLLTIWNSRNICDSGEAIHQTTETDTRADNSSKLTQDSSKERMFDTTTIDNSTNDLVKFFPESEIDKTSTEIFMHDNASLSEKDVIDFSKIIAKAIEDDNDKLAKKPTIDSKIIISETTAYNNNTISQKYKSDSNEDIFETTNNHKLAKKPASNNSEEHVDPIIPMVEMWSSELQSNYNRSDTILLLAQEKEFGGSPVLFTSNHIAVAENMLLLADNSSNICFESSLDTSLACSLDNLTVEPDLFRKKLNDQFLTKLITESEYARDSFSEIPEPIEIGMIPDDSIKGISELILSNTTTNYPSDVALKSTIVVLGDDQTLSDKLRGIIIDYKTNDTNTDESSVESTSSEYSSTSSFDDIILSLTRENETSLPISFDTTHILYNKTFLPLQNVTETNFLPDEHILKIDKNSFEKCPNIEGSTFENQCYIFKEPDNFNSISNLTNIITGKLRQINLEKPIDSLPDDFSNNIFLIDLIIGNNISNNKIEPQGGILFADNEVPDFSDYTTSQEEDTISDFFDIPSTNQDSFLYSLPPLNNTIPENTTLDYFETFEKEINSDYFDNMTILSNETETDRTQEHIEIFLSSNEYTVDSDSEKANIDILLTEVLKADSDSKQSVGRYRPIPHESDGIVNQSTDATLPDDSKADVSSKPPEKKAHKSNADTSNELSYTNTETKKLSESCKMNLLTTDKFSSEYDSDDIAYDSPANFCSSLLNNTFIDETPIVSLFVSSDYIANNEFDNDPLFEESFTEKSARQTDIVEDQMSDSDTDTSNETETIPHGFESFLTPIEYIVDLDSEKANIDIDLDFLVVQDNSDNISYIEFDASSEYGSNKIKKIFSESDISIFNGSADDTLLDESKADVFNIFSEELVVKKSDADTFNASDYTFTKTNKLSEFCEVKLLSTDKFSPEDYSDGVAFDFSHDFCSNISNDTMKDETLIEPSLDYTANNEFVDDFEFDPLVEESLTEKYASQTDIVEYKISDSDTVTSNETETNITTDSESLLTSVEYSVKSGLENTYIDMDFDVPNATDVIQENSDNNMSYSEFDFTKYSIVLFETGILNESADTTVPHESMADVSNINAEVQKSDIDTSNPKPHTY